MSVDAPAVETPKKTPAKRALEIDPVLAKAAVDAPTVAKRTQLVVTQFNEIKADGRGTGGNFSVKELTLHDGITDQERIVCVPLNLSPQDWPRAKTERVVAAYELEYTTEAERDRVLQVQRSPEGRPYGYGPHDPCAGHWVEGVGMVGNQNSPFRKGA